MKKCLRRILLPLNMMLLMSSLIVISVETSATTSKATNSSVSISNTSNTSNTSNASYNTSNTSNTIDEISFNLKITGPEAENIAEEIIIAKDTNGNLMEFMKNFCAEKGINFEEKNGLVLTIKDLKSDKEQGWLLYVNDKMSDKGAMEVIPAKGDKIEWRYIEYSKAFGN